MVLMLLLGLTAGLLFGSWGGYAMLKAEKDAADGKKHETAEKLELSDAETREADRKANEQTKRHLEGLMNILNYGGKPADWDGEVR